VRYSWGMRSLLVFSLLLAACAGSQPAPSSAAEATANDRTRERWKHEEEQRQIEQRRNSFTSNSSQRGEVQPGW